MNYNGMSLQELLRFAETSEDPLMRAVIKAAQNETSSLYKEVVWLEGLVGDVEAENSSLLRDSELDQKEIKSLEEELKDWKSQPKTLCVW